MNLSFKPFDDFIKTKTTAKTRSRYTDSQVLDLNLSTAGAILARVSGTKNYSVFIRYNEHEVLNVHCSCPYDQEGYCKHIVHVLVAADAQMELTPNQTDTKQTSLFEPQEASILTKNKKVFTLQHKTVLSLSENVINDISVKTSNRYWNSRMHIKTATFLINKMTVALEDYYDADVDILIDQKDDNIEFHCSCSNKTNKLCKHLKFVLLEVTREKLLQFSFDKSSRHQMLEEKARLSGFGTINDLDKFFTISLIHDRIYVEPRKQILPLSENKIRQYKEALLPRFQLPKSPTATSLKEFLVVSVDDWGANYTLMNAPLAKNGSLKSPVNETNIPAKLKDLSKPEEFLFFSALLSQNPYGNSDHDINLNIIKNPFKFPVYYVDRDWRSGKITPQKLKPVSVVADDLNACIAVDQEDGFYGLSLTIEFFGKRHSSKDCRLSGRYISWQDKLIFLKNEMIFKVLKFFWDNKHEFYLTDEQFKTFKQMFLDELEQSIQVKYSFIKKATKAFIKKERLDEITGHLIYLSESEDYILITPVIRYGEVEAPILSKRSVYAENETGALIEIERNETAELRFKRAVQEQHPEFEDNPHNTFYYLHKQKFLDEGWFIEAFEVWRNNGYTILGFSQLRNNKLNPHKMKVTSGLQSGIDWFDVHMAVSFGDQKIGLKEIQKSIVNQSRFVALGDGTQGLLPQEWIDKFSRYFRSGEIKGDFIRTHKSQFSLIDEMFAQEVMPQDVKIELETYREKLANFHSIRNVAIPRKLKATLRDYQKEGLNWLNFLDEFGFGGCLADDMGLGKTIQIIAYILSQIEKGNKTANLVVAPTSLIYNWEAELKKFAPSLKYHILYGPDREAEGIDYKKNQVIVTTYGTLMNDIEVLKNQSFNIIVLDESQAIKNPNSLRYKAVRLLNGRQKIVATGTPVENNTFDLYAQLSFAIPGLLGSARQFSADYANPIDKFHDNKRATELQKRVHPFILRRTKKQVATELPEKTEMVIYCEMDKEQRRVYDTYKTEFQKFLKGKDEGDVKTASLHVLQGLTKLRQICNCPSLLSDDEFYGSQSAKTDELMRQIQKLQGNHKILVFSQFVGMLNIIRDKLDKEKIKYAYLSGQTQKRQEQVDLFQEDDDVRVFLISLKAGGSGLNLTKAEYVFLVDPWWNPAVENQAIDRAYRIGQDKKVIAIRLITPDSIEEKIMKLQEQKKSLVEDLIRAESGFFKKLTKDDLLNLV